LYAAQVREAVAGSVDTRKLAEAWVALHPSSVPQASKAISPALSAFLGRASQAVQNALKPVLTRLWTEGWVLGNRSALAAADGLADVDWGAWKPGDYAAAEQIAGPGLRQLLGEAGIRIKSIADSRLEELSLVLEETLRSDEIRRQPGTEPLPPFLSVGDLAGRLRTVLDNPGRAELVAQAEIARAQATAARQVYAETGRTEVEVSTAEDDKVCPECDAAAKLGAHPLGAPPLVPLHPRCRCAELPVLATSGPVPVQRPAPEEPAVPAGHWPLSRVGRLQSGNEQGLTVEQEYQRKEVQGKYSKNDFERAKRAGFSHPRDYQASITSHVAEHGILSAAAASYGALDEGYHRYAAARQLGLQSMPVQESQ
jgi:hypothetical protein